MDSNLLSGTVTGANSNKDTIVKVSVTGATASKSLSAIITDRAGKKVNYYGKIANANIALPVTLDADNVLKIFI